MDHLTSKYSVCLRKIFTWNVFRNATATKKDRSELNLNKMFELSAKFGNPHLSFDTVHIAGTNGKGTVTIKTAACL